MLPLIAIVAGRMLVAATSPAYEMMIQSLATSRVDDRYLARMNAALRTLTNTTIPIACFAAGFLTTHIGAINVILIGAAVISTAAISLAIFAHRGRTTRRSPSMTALPAIS
jgi:hypothetical protein